MMTKESFQLDPNAVPYTDDEIVGKINSASTGAIITRAGSVATTARPIEDAEVTDLKLSSDAAKLNLDAMDELVRGYIITDPQTGEFPVLAIQRNSTGKLDVDYDNVAVST